ncbi:MAG: sigma-54 dependent transcriptional regulator [Limisphaerales bacterium]
MSQPLPPILLVDDEKNMRLSLTAMLADEGFPTEAVESAEQAEQLLEKREFLMLITDAHLGGLSGYELLARVKRRWPELPMLMITAYATPKLAAEAIKSGASDYLPKPFAPEELILHVSRCAERHRLITENATLRERVSDSYRLENIIGESPNMKEQRELIQRVAPTNATVLILGESGTGKELVAGALHSLSKRARKSYVRINCAAIPETLLESELFGHEKGAFTGALKQKLGRVEEADGGTIFLDEIGDMSRSLQAKLLRFLEDGSFTRVGGNDELKVNVRLLAATNRDIIQAIRENQFREDLYHRLNVVQFRPPPLRERGQDVCLLAEHFLKQFCTSLGRPLMTLSKPAATKLLGHHWPGNVRELRNVIERAVILAPGPQVQPMHLPDFELETKLRKGNGPAAPIPDSLDEALSNFEKQLILAALERNHFSINKTAERLKVTRHALRYRMQRLNLNTDASPEGDTDTLEK